MNKTIEVYIEKIHRLMMYVGKYTSLAMYAFMIIIATYINILNEEVNNFFIKLQPMLTYFGFVLILLLMSDYFGKRVDKI